MLRMDVEKLQLSHNTGTNVKECKMIQPLWKQSGSSLKSQMQQFHSWYLPKRNENISIQRHLQKCSLPWTRNHPKVHQLLNGRTKCVIAIQWNTSQQIQMNYQYMYDRNESQKQHNKWIMPDTKSYIQNDSIYMKCVEQAKL